MFKWLSKISLGYLLIFIICSIPLSFWLAMKPFSERFVNTGIFSTSLGQVLGLTGFCFFAVTLFLNTRVKFLENVFSGMGNVYFAHHLTGGIAFCLLLFHPVTLTVKYILVSFTSAANFLTPGNDIAVTFGSIALFAMSVFLILTFYVNLPYHVWKFTHQFLGIAFIFAGLHITFITSDITINQNLRLYMFSMLFLGVASYFYKTVLKEFTIKKHKYKVSSVEQLSKDIFEIILSPKNETLDYDMGQFIFISFNDRVIGTEEHPFSITSNPKDRELKIIFKNLGDYTSGLMNLKKETIASVEGPYGKFTQNGFKSDKQIWIAGGIGITPFINMAQNIGANCTVDLYYSVGRKEEAICLEEFKSISSANTKFRMILWNTDKLGRISPEKIFKNSNDLKNGDYFICGPVPMIQSLKEQLINQGIDKNKIHSEEFDLL